MTGGRRLSSPKSPRPDMSHRPSGRAVASGQQISRTHGCTRGHPGVVTLRCETMRLRVRFFPCREQSRKGRLE
jgi:hypothetical protein